MGSHRDRRWVEIGCRRASGTASTPSNRPNRSSRRIAVPEHAFPCRFCMRGCHGAMHERIGASPVFLARPVQPAELVKCVRAVLRKERGKRCLGVDIARWLGMDPRSLERHLRSEGTTFREISRQVQLQASQRLLKQGASVSDVAEALGFSEISAFTRAFRRWSGETPSCWKLRHARPKAELATPRASTPGEGS